MIMYGWFPAVPVRVWAAAFIVLVLVLNMVSVKIFAEAETLLSGIKVAAIILFIILGTAAIIGLLPYEGHRSAVGLTNLYTDGLFPNGFGAVFTTILAVNFAFSGKVLARTNRFGVPALAMGLSMIGGLAALLTSTYAASTVYLVLVSVSGLAVVLVWVVIATCHLSFRQRWLSWLSEGRGLHDLAYRAPGYPWVSIAALALSAASCLLIFFDATQRPALGITAVFLAVCYLGYWGANRRISL